METAVSSSPCASYPARHQLHFDLGDMDAHGTDAGFTIAGRITSTAIGQFPFLADENRTMQRTFKNTPSRAIQIDAAHAYRR